ncbi:MAG: radical SAM protein [Gemmatimonadota bacterium]
MARLPLPALRGRGVSWNPPNRFERLQVEREGWTDPDDPPPETVLLRDATRSILSFNESPDVGFDVGINPYRGCSHGCSYCLAPHTPVLYSDMTWRPIGEVRAGDVLVGFDEYPAPGRTRKLRPAVVEHVWWSRKPTRRLVTEEADLWTTAEHRWLQAGAFRWSTASQLGPGRLLRALPVARDEGSSRHYQHGYIAGLTQGDGTFRHEPGQGSDKLGFPQAYWRIAMKDVEPLARAAAYLREFGVNIAPRRFDPGAGRHPLTKIETRSLSNLERIRWLLTRRPRTRDYMRGFLAGFFDAEGHNGTSLRFTRVDVDVVARVHDYGRALGFTFDLERSTGRAASSLRLRGSLAERMRFFSACRPAIQRKVDGLFDHMPPTTPTRILAAEGGRERDVVDIQTTTGTFYAGGLATHNCYARPTHEYLGFSAGLDFETKILVKKEAPELLRKALAARSWVPRPIMLSGNTDAYQPAERRLRLTRRCLEVLTEARNPVAITTKSYLVTRDVDLLRDLAAHQAAGVTLSVTTLRPELQRALEPRASTPARRLGAIRVLADAGIPVGVNVAPVIPGLTEHELPAILDAAAQAGASFATMILLRLPHGVKDLFAGWLDQHAPDRKDKVLNRVREMRRGDLYRADFATRGRGEGPWAEQLQALFRLARDRHGLNRKPELSADSFRKPGVTPAGQMDLFA